MDEEIKVLERKLRNYRHLQKEIVRLEDEIQRDYDKLGASPKSPNLQSEPIHSPKNIDAEHEIREHISMLEAKLSQKRDELNELDEIFNSVRNELKRPIIDIYMNGKKYAYVAKKYNYSIAGIFKATQRELNRIIIEKRCE